MSGACCECGSGAGSSGHMLPALRALPVYVTKQRDGVGPSVRGGAILNKLVENDIRPTVVGRKRWLFIGHPQAGWRSAVIYSILISGGRRSLNPQEYFSGVLARLPSTNITQIQNLLPAHWKSPLRNVS